VQVLLLLLVGRVGFSYSQPTYPQLLWQHSWNKSQSMAPNLLLLLLRRRRLPCLAVSPQLQRLLLLLLLLLQGSLAATARMLEV
jgi:hypothetical protein